MGTVLDRGCVDDGAVVGGAICVVVIVEAEEGGGGGSAEPSQENTEGPITKTSALSTRDSRR